MNEEIKVGDRVEWCQEGNFEKWGKLFNPHFHDFGTVTLTTEHEVLAKWEGLGVETYTLKRNVRKVPARHEIERCAKMPQINKRLVELTQAELQFLVQLLKDRIGPTQSLARFMKSKCAELYELCDPNDGSTEDDFYYLNFQKDALRYWKNKNNKLSAIQAKLKRAR